MLSTPIQVVERRAKPRIDCSYPAIIQGRNASGRKFRVDATLTSLSASGLRLTLQADLGPYNKDIFVLFRCSSTGPLGDGKAPLIAVNGNVVRSIHLPKGSRAMGMKIHHSRFL